MKEGGGESCCGSRNTEWEPRVLLARRMMQCGRDKDDDDGERMMKRICSFLK